MTKAEYRAYLVSDEWRALRKQALYNAQWRCQVPTCRWSWLRPLTSEEILEFAPDAPKLQVHHLTYERLGHERLDDLLVICDDCHRKEHGISEGKPERRNGPKTLQEALILALTNMANGYQGR